jgi:thiosulfate dehydrogenase
MSVRYVVLVLAVVAACVRDPRNAPATATTADTALRAPDGSPVPGEALGRSILRGRAILAATRDSLPAHVGNALRCSSCHLGDGREPAAMSLIGSYARFPQFRWRSASVQRIEDRINDCFLRSMNGTPLSWDDPAMRDIVAYLAFISRGVAVGDTSDFAIGTALAGDTIAGAGVYAARCARCHGVADGAGVRPGAFPPLFGPKSFNIGAGMARIRTIQAFVLRNMPRDSAGTLTPAEAVNVAAYLTSRPRPDFADKTHDWPCGHRPPDAPYATPGTGCSAANPPAR